MRENHPAAICLATSSVVFTLCYENHHRKSERLYLVISGVFLFLIICFTKESIALVMGLNDFGYHHKKSGCQFEFS